MQRIRLIHWHEGEAAERAASLRQAGYRVDHGPLDPAGLKDLRQRPPVAVVIDLSRLPAQGRDVGLALRTSRSTRQVPLVFVGGDPAKVTRVKELLPDGVFTSWRGLRVALKRAIAHPPTDPVVPASNLAGYSGTPLIKKLGIKADSVLALIAAPADFDATLGDLPAGVVVRRQLRGRPDLIIYFAPSRHELRRRVARLGAVMAEGGGLWIAWRKKSAREKNSGVSTDLTQAFVRETGLATGLVDYKICAIDATWSGLKFARRKA